MSIRDVNSEIEDVIPVQTVLVSVFDKSGLEDMIPQLVEINPDVQILSSTGTYRKIKEVLGEAYANNLAEVADYTGFPEMDGGLVKTLNPHIFGGILGERNNPKHQAYLQELGVSFIDAVLCNLYPFSDVVAKEDTTFETARGNIDVGGPSMIRAAAKNFLGCASICNPDAYEAFIANLRINNGGTDLLFRSQQVQEVFEMTAQYDKDIAAYMSKELTGTTAMSYLPPGE